MPVIKSSARPAGVLFIVASITAIAGGSLLLRRDAPHAQLITGALLEVVLAIAVVSLAALLLPVLRPSSDGGAVLYVAIRTLEAGLILTGVVGALAATSRSASPTLALSVREWAYHLGTVLVFAVSAIVLNALLLRGRLAPPWLGWWGLAGGSLLLLRGVIDTYGSLPAPLQAALAAPIGIQEMVFAGWLIVRSRR
ncbi:DUF4386 domain-containing protein [Actinoplanes sp. NPDC051513]|uniref:DUF4386 domain-containing protein n=1 Tax=Actinoplanes sp. NPDC051513 TaxID=3363908 RepID=UPI00378870A7